ncbi:MAG: hypothetical protein ACK5XV_01585 [Flavobacteriales bacterium]|jgi:hypothetical protein
MKQIAFILIFSLGFIGICSSQSARDSVVMQKAFFGGYNFIYHGEMLKIKHVVNLMEPNAAAYKQMKSARANNSVANVLGAAGGFLVGWTLGDLAGGEDPNYTVMGVGGALIVASIPFSVVTVKKSREAVATWNSGLSTSSLRPRGELKLGMTGFGLGLTYRF